MVSDPSNIAQELYKIGLTKNIPHRLCGMRTSNPHIKCIHKKKVENMINAEKLLHKHYANTRTVGEWFVIKNIEQCINYMDSLN